MENLATVNTLDAMANHMGNFDSHKTYVDEQRFNTLITDCIKLGNLMPQNCSEKIKTYIYDPANSDESIPQTMLDQLTSAEKYSNLLLNRILTEFGKHEKSIQRKRKIIQSAIKNRDNLRNQQIVKNERIATAECCALQRINQLPNEIVDIIKSYLDMPKFRLDFMMTRMLKTVCYDLLMKMKKKPLFNLATKLCYRNRSLFYKSFGKEQLNTRNLDFMKKIDRYSGCSKRFIASDIVLDIDKLKSVITKVESNKMTFTIIDHATKTKTNVSKEKEAALKNHLFRMYQTILYASRPEFNKTKKIAKTV